MSEQPENVLPPTVFTKSKRATIRASLAFCGATIVWCLTRVSPTSVHETATEYAFLTGAAIIGAYVFGAAWQTRK